MAFSNPNPWPPTNLGISNAFRQSYLSTFLDVSGPTTVRGDLSMNGNLFVGNDSTLSGRLFMNGSSISSTYLLDVTGNIRSQQNFFVTNDSTLSGRLFMNGSSMTSQYLLDITGNVRAANFYATSDERAKTNINSIDDNDALNKLRNFTPRTFNFITNGNITNYGFIAQEIEKIIPNSVSTTSDYIPNIYEHVCVNDGNILTLKTKSTNIFETDLSGNIFPKIKLYNNTEEIISTITDVIDEKSFKISNIINESSVFLYGQHVDNFKALDKNEIFTVTCAALQCIDTIVQQQQSQIIGLELENSNLKTQMKNISERLSILEYSRV